MMLQPSSAQSSVAKSSSFDRAADDLDAMLKRRLVAGDRCAEEMELYLADMRNWLLDPARHRDHNPDARQIGKSAQP